MVKNKVEELTIEEKLNNALIPVDKQPYKIPQNWCWVKTESIFSIVYGKGLSSKDLIEKGFPVFGANGQIGYYNEYMFEQPKALMSCRGAYSGVMNFSFPKSFITSNSLIIEGKNISIPAKFIYYLYSTLNVKRIVTGSAQPQITINKLKVVPVPLPPLAEQERIVNKLDNYISKLDEAKEKLEKVVDTYNYRKNLILYRAFTGQLTKNWRKENNISFDNWVNTNIGNVCKDVKVGIVIKPSQYYTDEKNGTPAFRSANVREFHVDNFDWVYLNPIGMKLNKRTIVHTGDILIVRSGNPGTACMVTEEFDGFNAIDVLIAIPNKDKILSEFLCAYTNSPIIRDEIFANKRGSVIEHFNVRSYSKLPINLPPLEEQKEIVKILDSVLSKEKQVKEIAEKEIERVEDLKKNLLTRAFGGVLGTNDPNEENSIELLKTVL